MNAHSVFQETTRLVRHHGWTVRVTDGNITFVPPGGIGDCHEPLSALQKFYALQHDVRFVEVIRTCSDLRVLGQIRRIVRKQSACDGRRRPSERRIRHKLLRMATSSPVVQPPTAPAPCPAAQQLAA